MRMIFALGRRYFETPRGAGFVRGVLGFSALATRSPWITGYIRVALILSRIQWASRGYGSWAACASC